MRDMFYSIKVLLLALLNSISVWNKSFIVDGGNDLV